MTCIVGLESDGSVYLGGDSAAMSGWSLLIRADEKVFVSGEFVMGFTSSFRMGQLLRYNLHVPAIDVNQTPTEYMTTTFVDSVRKTLKDGGYATVENGKETGGTFLVGYRGQLFVVEQDFQVGRPLDGYAACGCGADLALGAMYATRGLDAEHRIETALDAAERFNGGVRGPFVVVRR